MLLGDYYDEVIEKIAEGETIPAPKITVNEFKERLADRLSRGAKKSPVWKERRNLHLTAGGGLGGLAGLVAASGKKLGTKSKILATLAGSAAGSGGGYALANNKLKNNARGAASAIAERALLRRRLENNGVSLS